MLTNHGVGTQIFVFGLLPPGSEPVSASYSIDGGPPQTRTLEASPSTSYFIGNTTYFGSQQLTNTGHNLTISVEQTGQNGRDFTLDYFEVVQVKSNSSQNMSSSSNKISGSKSGGGSHVGAIVGGILGAFAFLLLAGLFLFFRRRKTCQLRTQRAKPQMIYYGQPQAIIEEPRSTLVLGYHATLFSDRVYLSYT